MRKLLIVTLILIATLSTAFTSYAWFTYVQRKSIASFISKEIIVYTEANDEIILNEFILDELAYIDFEDDLLYNLSNAFDQVATSIEIDVVLDSDSPLSRHLISVEVNHDALIMLIVYEGVNLDIGYEYLTAYHQLIQTISTPLIIKEDVLNAIQQYNINVLNMIYDIVIFPEDELSFQLVFWVDYDLIEFPDNYLEYTFSMIVKISSVSAKKEVN